MSENDDKHDNDVPITDKDTRKTAMLIFRDEGVDWAQLAADDRAKELFQKLVDWALDLKRRGVYAGVEALQPNGKTVRRKARGWSSTVLSPRGAKRCSASSSCASKTSTRRVRLPLNRRTPRWVVRPRYGCSGIFRSPSRL